MPRDLAALEPRADALAGRALRRCLRLRCFEPLFRRSFLRSKEVSRRSALVQAWFAACFSEALRAGPRFSAAVSRGLV